jgi:hypothetical protein
MAKIRKIYNSEARELAKKLDSYNVLNVTPKVLNVSYYRYDRKWLAIYLNIAPLNYHYARLQLNIKLI